MDDMKQGDVVAAACEAAARHFRLGEEAAGCACVERISDGLAALASQGDARIQSLVGALGEVVAAQSRGDFLRVADVVEYVVAPALRT